MKSFGYVITAILILVLAISVNAKLDIIDFGNKNVLELASGKVVLGEVYRESLETVYKVTFEGRVFPDIHVQAATEYLYMDVKARYVSYLSNANKQRKKNGLPPLHIESAVWLNEVEISYVTSVTYESEYHSNLAIVVDKSLIKDDSKQASLMKYSEEVLQYADRVYKEYDQKYSFID